MKYIYEVCEIKYILASFPDLFLQYFPIPDFYLSIEIFVTKYSIQDIYAIFLNPFSLNT